MTNEALLSYEGWCYFRDWLGTCCLPLTEDASQLFGLREYLDGQDGAYQAFKEAFLEFHYKRKTSRSETLHKPKPRVLLKKWRFSFPVTLGWCFSLDCFIGAFTAKPWSASMAACTVYKIVKVYVGTHWYATYLQTLLKVREMFQCSVAFTMAFNQPFVNLLICYDK